MKEMRIPLSSPDIDEGDIAAVVRVMQTLRLSLGPALAQFERAFTDYVGAPYAVALSSGTAGLHLALLALGIGPGDEVIVASFTFIAAANAIRYVGATPIFVDIDATTLNMDPKCVEQAVTSRTKALMVAHTFGVPADLEALLEIASRRGLKVIEDACEAIGAEYKGRKVGTFGDAGVFGFYPNKQMTTGEGGMVATNNPEVAATVRSLRNQGRRPGDDWFEHSEVGYNYRISEMHCALGLSQLGRVASFLERRKAAAVAYQRRLRGHPALILPPLSIQERSISWFVYVVRLSADFDVQHRDAIRKCLNDAGIGCGRYFAPIHLQPAFRSSASAQIQLPVTESVADRALALPFFAGIANREIEEVCDCLARALLQIRGPSRRG